MVSGANLFLLPLDSYVPTMCLTPPHLKTNMYRWTLTVIIQFSLLFKQLSPKILIKCEVFLFYFYIYVYMLLAKLLIHSSILSCVWPLGVLGGCVCLPRVAFCTCELLFFSPSLTLPLSSIHLSDSPSRPWTGWPVGGWKTGCSLVLLSSGADELTSSSRSHSVRHGNWMCSFIANMFVILSTYIT